MRFIIWSFGYVPILFLLIIFILFIIAIIIHNVISGSKKNCFNCKYYEMCEIGSFLGVCWYKCTKKETKPEFHYLKDKRKLVWCEYFEDRKEN